MRGVVASIRWHLMFRVQSERAARLQLKRAGARIGRPLEVLGCKKYWKIPELWECDARSQIGAGTTAERIVASFQDANALAQGWYILGPYLDKRGRFESLSGVFNVPTGGRALVNSLEWAEFELLM